MGSSKSTNPTEPSAYMLDTPTDRDRLYAQFDLFRSWFARALPRALTLAGVAVDGPWTALDVACGEGLYAAEVTEQYPAAHVTGVDLDPDAIATARAACAGRANVAFHVADVHEPLAPAVGRSFDLAFLICALTHFRRGDVALRRVFDALRPGGAVLLLDPTARMFEYPHPALEPLRRAIAAAWKDFGTYAAGDVQASLLSQAGFVDVSTEANDYVIGGATGRGALKLTLLLELISSMRAALVERARVISAAEFDVGLARLRASRSPKLEGTYFYRMALARRPA